MKRVAALVSVILAVASAGAQELKVGTIEGMASFSPLIAKVLKDAGYNMKVVTYPQQGALLQELAKGAVDGAFFLAQPLIASVKAVRVPIRIGQTDFYAVATDPNVKVANSGDLRKYTVGIVKDNPAHDAITRGMTVTATASDVEQFKMLAAGSFQVAISIPQMIPIMCKLAGIKDFYIQKPPLLMTPTFFALSAPQAGIEPKVEAAFKKWVDSGQWEKQASVISQ
jgi:hypothetical protein